MGNCNVCLRRDQLDGMIEKDRTLEAESGRVGEQDWRKKETKRSESKRVSWIWMHPH